MREGRRGGKNRNTRRKKGVCVVDQSMQSHPIPSTVSISVDVLREQSEGLQCWRSHATH